MNLGSKLKGNCMKAGSRTKGQRTSICSKFKDPTSCSS